MFKINRWLLVFFLGMLWPAAVALGDEDLSSDISPALSAPSGTSDETKPEAATLKRETSREMIPAETTSADLAPGDTASEKAMPEATTLKKETSREMIPAEATLADSASGDTMSEKTRPGIDSAVQMAQEEVRDPFAVLIEPEPPAEEKIAPEAAPVVAPMGPVQPVGPPTEVNLQGIGFGNKDAYAVIGNEVFYIGDEKNGIKLLEVRKREVDIQVNGGKVTVPLFPGEDLQKARDRAQERGSAKDASLDQKSKI